MFRSREKSARQTLHQSAIAPYTDKIARAITETTLSTMIGNMSSRARTLLRGQARCQKGARSERSSARAAGSRVRDPTADSW
jgi:hypothetical protein